jgi:Tol biopolymer transport system component
MRKQDAKPKPQLLMLKILSNKEQTLVAAEFKTNSYTAQKIFSPDLYYWKLEAKDELIYVGKFVAK